MARILLAERDKGVRDFIAGILGDFGHEVDLCADREEADDRLAATQVEIVVTDLVLQGGEGLRFGLRCRALGIPTVTLSGVEFRPDRAEAERPQPLFDKPFRFADLHCVVDAVSQLGPAARAPRRATRRAA